MKKVLKLKPVEPAIAIKGKDNKEFARFENNGDVYLKGRKIDVDKELAQLFTLCIIELSGFSPEEILKEIRKQK